MKTTITLITLLLAIAAEAQLQFVDYATPHTNTVVYGGLLSVPGGGHTNAPASLVVSTNIQYGEALNTAFQKLSNSMVWLMVNATNAARTVVNDTNVIKSTNYFTTVNNFYGANTQVSNTWNWASVTNGHAPGQLWTVNSNGVALVTLWWTNGGQPGIVWRVP